MNYKRFIVVFTACVVCLFLGTILVVGKLDFYEIIAILALIVVSAIATSLLDSAEDSYYWTFKNQMREYSIGADGTKLLVLHENGITSLRFLYSKVGGGLFAESVASFFGFQRMLLQAVRKRLQAGVHDLFQNRVRSALLRSEELRKTEAVNALARVLAEVIMATQRRSAQLVSQTDHAELLAKLVTELTRAHGSRSRAALVVDLQGYVEQYAQNIELLTRHYISTDKGANGWRFADNSLLPEGAVYASTVANTHFYVIVRPPSVRSLKFSRKLLTGETEEFKSSLIRDSDGGYVIPLALPYQIFVCAVCPGRRTQMSVFFAVNPLRALDDSLLAAAMPNYEELDGSICLGSNKVSPEGSPGDIAENHIAFWYTAPFTDSLTRSWDALRGSDPRVETLEAWYMNSMENPGFILDVNFPSSKCTPISVLQTMLRGSYEVREDSQEKFFTGEVQRIGTNLLGRVQNRLAQFAQGEEFPNQNRRVIRDALVDLLTMCKEQVESDLRELLDSVLSEQLPDFLVESVLATVLVLGEAELLAILEQHLVIPEPSEAFNVGQAASMGEAVDA